MDSSLHLYEVQHEPSSLLSSLSYHHTKDKTEVSRYFCNEGKKFMQHDVLMVAKKRA